MPNTSVLAAAIGLPSEQSNDAKRPSRRAILTSIPAAAIGVGALGAGVAAAAGPTEMENAFFAWRPLRETALAAYAKESPLVERYNSAHRNKPVALKWRMTDDVGYETGPSSEPGKYQLFVEDSEETRETLRRIVSGEDASEFGDPDRRRARAQEILQSFATFEAEMADFSKSIGLEEAEEAANAACDAEYEAQQRIRSAPIKDFRDLAFRAAVAKSCDRYGSEEIEFLLDNLIDLAGIPALNI